MFLSSAADMATNLFGFDGSYAALVTAYLNLVNFTGRFGWGFLSDRMGRKTFFVMSAATQVSVPTRHGVPSACCHTCVPSA